MTSAATATSPVGAGTGAADLLGFTVDGDGGGGGVRADVLFSSSPDQQGLAEQQQLGEAEGGVRESTIPSPHAASASGEGEAEGGKDAEKCPLGPSSAPAPSRASQLTEDDDRGDGGATAASDDDYATPPEEDGGSSDDDNGGHGRANGEKSSGDGDADLRQQRQASIDAIKAVHLEMDELEARAKLEGTSAALVHELVTQMCCRLDGIDTHGSDEVRSLRRAAIARAEGIDSGGGGCGTGSDANSQQGGNAPVPPTESERRGLEGINPFDEFRDVLPVPLAANAADPPPPGSSAPPAERKPIMNDAPAATGGGGMDVFMNVTSTGGNNTDGNADNGVDKSKENHTIIGPIQNSVVPLDHAPAATIGEADMVSTMDRDQGVQRQHPGPTNASTVQEDLLGGAMVQHPQHGQPQAQESKLGSRDTSDVSLQLVSSAESGNGAGTEGNVDVFAGLFGAGTVEGGGGDDTPSATPPAPVDTDTTPTTSTPGTARSSVGNLSVDDIVLAAPSALVPSTPPVIPHGKVPAPDGVAGGGLMDLGIGLFDGDQGDDRPSPSPTPATAAATVPATEASAASQSVTGAAPSPVPPSSSPSSFSSSPQMQNLQQQLDAWEATRASAAAAAPVSPTGSTEPKAATAGEDDPFGIFSGGGGGEAVPARDVTRGNGAEGASPGQAHGPVRVGSGSGTLPPGGTTYETKIYAARVGIMFLTARHLADTLFLAVPDDDKRRLLSALGERPVVAFMVERSGGLDAGVKLGHVLLSVDGHDVKNPVDAQRRIAEGPRPLPVKFYVPDVPVVSAEGMHMVKYDVNTTYAPSTSGEWKLKYVVVGGVIAKKWQINMYRSKADYDEAVSAVLAGRPIPVKIKQFSLVGGSRMLDNGDVKTVRYKDRPKAWRYVVVERPEIPGSFPIKIAHGSVDGLRPVMRGIQYAMAGRNETKVPTANTGRKGTGNAGFFQPMLGRKGKKKSSKAKR